MFKQQLGKQHFNISRENFRPQLSDWFPIKLEEVFSRIILDIEANVKLTNQEIVKNYGKTISDMIFKRFKLKVELSPYLWGASIAGIFSFSTLKLGTGGRKGYPDLAKETKATAMDEIDDEFINQYLQALENINEDRRHEVSSISNTDGYIDFNKLQVGGYFSKVTNTLVLDFITLVNDLEMNAAEITALAVHEIGHPFSSFAFEADLVGTNYIIERVTNALEDNDIETAIMIYRSSFGSEDLKKAGISRESTKEHFYPNLLARYGDVYLSHYGSGLVDITQSEALADDFAVLFGLGLPLTTALEKMNRLDGGPSADGIAFETSMVVAVGLLLLLIPNPLVLLGGKLTIVALFGSMFSKLKSQVFNPYDTDKERFARIRRQSIELLKGSSVTKKEVDTLIETIDYLEKVILETKDNTFLNNKSWLKTAAFIDRTAKQKQRTTRIEKFLSNDLFVLTHKLKNI